MTFKSSVTVKNMLVRKRHEKPRTFGVVFRIPCSVPDCDWSRVDGSGRTEGERRKEHQKDVDSSEVEDTCLKVISVEVSQAHVVDIEPLEKRIVKEIIWSKDFGSCKKTKHTLSGRWRMSNCLPRPV